MSEDTAVKQKGDFKSKRIIILIILIAIIIVFVPVMLGIIYLASKGEVK